VEPGKTTSETSQGPPKENLKKKTHKRTLVANFVFFFFFFGEFSPPGDKNKKGWRIQQRDF